MAQTSRTSSSGGGAGQLILDKIAGETISALKLVISDGNNEVIVADPNGAFEGAQVLGIALNSANVGEEVRVLTQGALQDSSFAFSINSQLYLGTNGFVTDTPPATGHRVLVAKAIETDEIYLEIEETIIL